MRRPVFQYSLQMPARYHSRPDSPVCIRRQCGCIRPPPGQPFPVKKHSRTSKRRWETDPVAFGGVSPELFINCIIPISGPEHCKFISGGFDFFPVYFALKFTDIKSFIFIYYSFINMTAGWKNFSRAEIFNLIYAGNRKKCTAGVDKCCRFCREA